MKRPKKLRSVRLTKDYTKPPTKLPRFTLTVVVVDAVETTGVINDPNKSPDLTLQTKEVAAAIAVVTTGAINSPD